MADRAPNGMLHARASSGSIGRLPIPFLVIGLLVIRLSDHFLSDCHCVNGNPSFHGKCRLSVASFPGLPLLEGKNKGEEGLVELIT